jgi:hypothetical protein
VPHLGARLEAALEKLRDAVAGGEIECIYVHAPDRLARRHAQQVLLIEEFRRSGAEIVFLNRAISRTAEDESCCRFKASLPNTSGPRFWSARGAGIGMRLALARSVH